MAKPTGGPAFPLAPTPSNKGSTGMSLRDYFAGQALQYCLDGRFTAHGLREDGGTILYYGNAAEAYAIADAMIEERDK